MSQCHAKLCVSLCSIYFHWYSQNFGIKCTAAIWLGPGMANINAMGKCCVNSSTQAIENLLLDGPIHIQQCLQTLKSC